MDQQEVVKDRSFRLAVMKGEYTRSISLYLRLRFPGKSIDFMPREYLQEAQVAVDNAFYDRLQIENELCQEMR